ncbi:Fringe glycosyltransferase [Eumeta japonica]|uniref:Fringe glycosyltransferase n=1 Tax=Eumeta variegata TaxID=151549 RepID=A0A4C1ZPS2_EUMVA|nr:Fringe glycosyltransferase [Eumeta japonica]
MRKFLIARRSDRGAPLRSGPATSSSRSSAAVELQLKKLPARDLAESPISTDSTANVLLLQMFKYSLNVSSYWWFCHFDDDNYVNVPRLENVLKGYNPQEEWYLGRTSVYEPIKIYNKGTNKIFGKKKMYPANEYPISPVAIELGLLKAPNSDQSFQRTSLKLRWLNSVTKIRRRPTALVPNDPDGSALRFSFWFATGGAGFCISRALAFRMLPVASGGRFISICEGIRLPDDVTMGFIIEQLLKRKLTVVKEFHSHFEQLKFIEPETFKDQISFSYSKPKGEPNVVQVPGFDVAFDPTSARNRSPQKRSSNAGRLARILSIARPLFASKKNKKKKARPTGDLDIGIRDDRSVDRKECLNEMNRVGDLIGCCHDDITRALAMLRNARAKLGERSYLIIPTRPTIFKILCEQRVVIKTNGPVVTDTSGPPSECIRPVLEQRRVWSC